METIWGIVIGGLLTIGGSIIGQILVAKRETHQWELNRRAQIEDKKIDLKIKVTQDRCDQIEKAMRIYTQDFFHLDYFFQRCWNLPIKEEDFELAQKFVKEKGLEMWDARNPEIQEMYNLNAIVYSIGKNEMEEEWEKLLSSWNDFVTIANGLIKDFEYNYRAYILTASSEESILYKTQSQFRESSRKIYIMLNEIRSTF